MLDLADLADALTTDYGGERNERIGAYIERNLRAGAVTADTAHLDLVINHDNGTAEAYDLVITRKARP